MFSKNLAICWMGHWTLILLPSVIGQTPLLEADLNDLWVRELSEPQLRSGDFAANNAYPHMVAIVSFIANGAHVHNCGGIIVAPSWVLTADSCLSSELVIVIAGAYQYTNDQETRQVRITSSKFFRPPRHPGHFQDVALVRLPKPLEFNDYIKRAVFHIPPQTQDFKVMITGWGDTYELALAGRVLEREAWIKSGSYCISELGLKRFVDSALCIESKDKFCHDDQGAVVGIHDGQKVVGMGSFLSAETCGEQKIVTKLSYFIDWINETIEANTEAQCHGSGENGGPNILVTNGTTGNTTFTTTGGTGHTFATLITSLTLAWPLTLT